MRARLQQKSRSLNLKYASDDLRRDRKVVITAVLNHPGALVYCLDEALRTELTGLRRAQLHSGATCPRPSRARPRVAATRWMGCCSLSAGEKTGG